MNLRETMSQYGKALVVSDNMGLLRRAYESGTITLTNFVLDVNFFVDADIQYIELNVYSEVMTINISKENNVCY